MENTTGLARAFGIRLRRHRNERGWTAQELAAEVTALGVPTKRATVAKLEKGLRESGPTLDEAVAFAVALRVPLPLLLVPESADLYALVPNLDVSPGRALNWLLRGEPLTNERVTEWTKPAWPVWQFHATAEASAEASRAGNAVRNAIREGTDSAAAREVYRVRLEVLREACDALDQLGLDGSGWWTRSDEEDLTALQGPAAHTAPLYGRHLPRTDQAEELKDDEREWVTMQHPVTGGVARATRRAFERVWTARGWQLADAAEEDA